MTQEECLASPHHFTHLGVCYPGGVAYVQLSSANDPKQATFTTVPEPSMLALFAVALVVGVVALRIRGGTKLG
jgi:hypothetical protein